MCLLTYRVPVCIHRVPAPFPGHTHAPLRMHGVIACFIRNVHHRLPTSPRANQFANNSHLPRHLAGHHLQLLQHGRKLDEAHDGVWSAVERPPATRRQPVVPTALCSRPAVAFRAAAAAAVAAVAAVAVAAAAVASAVTAAAVAASPASRRLLAASTGRARSSAHERIPVERHSWRVPQERDWADLRARWRANIHTVVACRVGTLERRVVLAGDLELRAGRAAVIAQQAARGGAGRAGATAAVTAHAGRLGWHDAAPPSLGRLVVARVQRGGTCVTGCQFTRRVPVCVAARI
eukprot:364310-Chlamydomonas_euryale.AAC.13